MTKWIACGALALYAAIIAATWAIGTRQARQKTEALLDFAMIDFNDTTEGIAKLLSDAGAPGFGHEDLTPARYKWLLDHFYDDWLVGEKGFFLCANEETGRLVSNPARHRDEAHTLAETGFDMAAVEAEIVDAQAAAPNAPATPPDKHGRPTFRTRLFGEVSDCRMVVRRGHRIIAAVPMSEFYGTRTAFVAVSAAAFFVILAIFSYFVWRVAEDTAQLKRYYADEDERRARDMKVARTIQRAVLPSAFPAFPERPEFDLAAHVATAREVGGDFYDYFMLSAEHLAFAVADVSGKGVPAAMFMMAARAALRSAASQAHDPAAILALANSRLAEDNDAEMFVTVWLGILDTATGEIAFANAGHNPPLVRRADGAVEPVEGPRSLVLAAMPATRYKTGHTRLAPGDALLLFTDGVTEATDATGEFFGDERLVATLGSCASNSPATICNQLRFTLAAFAAGAQQADDITLLAIEYRPRSLVRHYQATHDALRQAADFLNAALAAERIAFKRRRDLAVILDEISSNVVRCSGAKSFSLAIAFGDGAVTMTVADDGEEYDPLKRGNPNTAAPAQERQIGGLGIFLARRLSSSIAYRREEGRNVLTVVA